MTIYLKDYRPSKWQVSQVYLHFDLDKQSTTVTSKLQFIGAEGQLVLHGERLDLQSLSVQSAGGKTIDQLDYHYDGKLLTISHMPADGILTTTVIIHPSDNTQLMGLYQSGDHLCTQCEAEGFRNITFFLDRPDCLARFDVTIVANQQQYPFLLSNGNLKYSKTLSDGKHECHWQDPFPKPCYLFALVAGDFDVIHNEYTTKEQRKVDLFVYVEKGYQHQAHFALKSLERAMRWDENTYGLSYDLDRFMLVAVADFNMGAMENKGLNIFNMKYVLADEAIATDDDYFNIESVVAHEYFHNWTGNRVTCRDWFQLTLKEGLTVFRDQTFSEDLHSNKTVRLDEIIQLTQRQFSEDAGPMAHPIQPKAYQEINNFYTATVYEKGAEIIRMMRTLLGTDVFVQGVKTYLDQYDGQAVTVHDFADTVLGQSKENLSQFKRWYDQVGTPIIHVKREASDGQACLVIQQKPVMDAEQKTIAPLLIPLRCSVFSHNEKVFDQVLILSQEITTVHLPLEPNQDYVYALNHQLTAPIKVYDDLSIAECFTLLVAESDAYVCYALLQRIHLHFIRHQMPVQPDLKAFFDNAILRHDAGVVARWLRLPTLHDLDFSDDDTVNQSYQNILAYEQQLAQLLCSSLSKYVIKLSSTIHQLAPLKGRDERSLYATLLKLWCESGDSLALEHVKNVFEQSTLLTVKLACINAVKNHHEELVEQWFQQLIQENNHPNIVNQWFRCIGGSTLSNRTAALKKAINSNDFSWKNPNNIYALLGPLTQNIYVLVTEEGLLTQLLQWIHLIDQNNGQVASRLLQTLVRFQRWDTDTVTFFYEALTQFKELSPFSNDVQEVLDKALQNVH
ncbi:MAG: aminopeptidase N [Candidatus Comchoanobacterales bacterium]